MIQYRLLNRSRGPAVQAPRVQADKYRYQTLAKQTLELEKNLHLFQDTVTDFVVEEAGAPPRRLSAGPVGNGTVRAVVTARGREISASAVVV